MRRMTAVFLSLILVCTLASCSSAGDTSQGAGTTGGEGSSAPPQANLVIAYDSQGADDPVEQVALLLQETLGGDLYAIGSEESQDFSAYEFVLLGFQAQNSALPQPIQDFLQANDLGARTIYPFVWGRGNDPTALFNAISLLEPGALLLTDETQEQEIAAWAQDLGLQADTLAPQEGSGNTVATATVTPHAQQVLYLWEEGNMPATTEYTVNNGRYSDDPDFRPYLTTFPVPEGTPVKGAVLICPGGAFQFRSDQPEGVEVAQALSALGYQSFVVDYRLRPYTQQEGALDLARAVRFVRANGAAYGIQEEDIAVMGFSAGGILSGEMLLNFDGLVNGTALDPDYQPDGLDNVSADAAACGMIYAFYGRLSVGTTDVSLLRSGNLPPTFYCYGTRDPFYSQFLANADAAQQAGLPVERLQLDGMPHGFGAQGGWIPAYDSWLTEIFAD